jgi:signal transduction histidine kinase
VLDAATAAALSVVLMIHLVAGRDPAPISLLAGPIATTTVAWRRRAPAAAVLVAGAAVTVLRDPAPLAQVILIPMVVVLDYYMLGRQPGARGRQYADLVLLVVPLPAIWFTPGDDQLIGLVSVWLFFFALPYLAGRTIATQTAATRALALEAAQAEGEQRAAAGRAIAAERARIARDLHDVVAHNISVMAVQTVAARRVARQDAESARKALEAVAMCGREAVVEMRRIVGVMRRHDVELTAVWQPGLDQLEALANRARSAGVQVEVRVQGSRRDLSPARDVVAFRVVQEALTNVIKHAGPTAAVVTVHHDPTLVRLAVVDGGALTPGQVPAAQHAPVGHGLIGMAERLALYGGSMRAGRTGKGGFEVVASIPRAELDEP